MMVLLTSSFFIFTGCSGEEDDINNTNQSQEQSIQEQSIIVGKWKVYDASCTCNQYADGYGEEFKKEKRMAQIGNVWDFDEEGFFSCISGEFGDYTYVERVPEKSGTLQIAGLKPFDVNFWTTTDTLHVYHYGSGAKGYEGDWSVGISLVRK